MSPSCSVQGLNTHHSLNTHPHTHLNTVVDYIVCSYLYTVQVELHGRGGGAVVSGISSLGRGRRRRRRCRVRWECFGQGGHSPGRLVWRGGGGDGEVEPEDVCTHHVSLGAGRTPTDPCQPLQPQCPSVLPETLSHDGWVSPGSQTASKSSKS